MMKNKFSKKTIGLAAATAVAVGGVGVVAPEGSLVTASVASAQAQTHVQPGDVKKVGDVGAIYHDVDGTPEGVSGPFRSVYGKNDAATLIDRNGKWYLPYSIDIANASAGDSVTIRPVNTYVNPVSGATESTSYYGLRISASKQEEPLNVQVGSQIIQVGTLKYDAGSVAKVTFNDAVNDLSAGSVEFRLPVSAYDSYMNNTGVAVNTYTPTLNTANIEVTTNTVSSPRVLETISPTHIAVIEQRSYAQVNNLYMDSIAVKIAPDGTLIGSGFTVRMPMGIDSTVTLNSKIPEGVTNAVPYVFVNGLTIRPEIEIYNEKGIVTETLSFNEAQKRYPTMLVESSQNGQTLTMTTRNVPDNVKVYWNVRHPDNTVLKGSYLPGGNLYTTWTFTPHEDATGISANYRTMYVNIPAAPELSSGTAEQAVRTANITPSVAGQPAGAGITSPANVAGKTTTFNFQVKNTGNAVLAAPLVTLPNGEQKIIEGVTIQPGQTGTVSVSYDVPAGTTAAQFKLNFAGAALSPSDTFNFAIGQAGPSLQEYETVVKDLEKAQSEIKDLTNKIGNLEQQLKDAATQAGADKKALEKQIADAKSELQTKINEANAKITQLEDTLKAANTDRADLRSQLDQAKKDIAAAEVAVKTAQKTADEAKAAANKAQNELNAEKAKVKALQDDLAKANDAITKAQKDATAANNKAADLQKQLDAEKSRATQNEAKIADLQKQLDTEKARITAAETVIVSQSEKITQLQNDLAAANKKLGEANAEIAKLKQDLGSANERITALEKTASELTEQLKEANKELGRVDQELKDARAAIERAQAQADKADAKADKAQATADEVKADLAAEKARVDGLTQELEATNTALEQAKEDAVKGIAGAEEKISDLTKRVAELELEAAQSQGRQEVMQVNIDALKKGQEAGDERDQLSDHRIADLESDNADLVKRLEALEARIADFRDGKDGAAGADGRDGANGAQGTAGQDGKTGVDGQTGDAGADGKSDVAGSDADALDGGAKSTGKTVDTDSTNNINNTDDKADTDSDDAAKPQASNTDVKIADGAKVAGPKVSTGGELKETQSWWKKFLDWLGF